MGMYDDSNDSAVNITYPQIHQNELLDLARLQAPSQGPRFQRGGLPGIQAEEAEPAALFLFLAKYSS